MIKHYHLIGIGGIGMSALARILLNKGEKVTGSDLQESKTLSQLQKEGAKISIGHSSKNVGRPHVVVYSTDIPSDNPELLHSMKKNIMLLHRSELLAQLMEGYIPILIAGTHGKTTTAALLTHILLEMNLDPSFAIGGYLKGINANGHWGKGNYFTAEADESDGSFLKYPSFAGIITNVEVDHMEYWKSEAALRNAFNQFALRVGSKKHLFWCSDDAHLLSLDLPGYSYGFAEKSDLYIENFQQIQWNCTFDFSFEGKTYNNVVIPLIGAHNVQNAAAAFGLALKLDLAEKGIRSSLKTFAGIGRRVEKKGEWGTIEVYDDYAHHPTEIFATLRALKSVIHSKKRIVVAFQPHRYTRTKCCMDDFADAFEYADGVILTDIYSAKETPIPGITSEALLDQIKNKGFKNICFSPRKNLPLFLADYLKPGDLLITMGAGDITQIGPEILALLKEK